MQTHLSQMIELVLSGNAGLRDIPVNKLDNASQNFQFCEQVVFSERANSGSPDQIKTLFDSPERWIEHLAASKAKSLKLQYCDRSEIFAPSETRTNSLERTTNGFVGGGAFWAIVTKFEEQPDVQWSSNWAVWDRLAADRRIWRVDYISFDQPMPFRQTSFSQATKKLRRALVEIEKFAANEKLGNWANVFLKAQNTLNGEKEKHHLAFLDDFPSEILDYEAKLLLIAASQASAFGGMGSWNDIIPQNTKLYAKVSDNLYDAVNTAIATAVNRYPAGISANPRRTFWNWFGFN